MDTLNSKTSNGKSVQDIFLGKIIKRTIAKERLLRSSMTFEFDDCSAARVWFEVIELGDWEITGALRIEVVSSSSGSQGVAHDVLPPSGFFVSGVSLLSASVEPDGVEHQVANGLVLSDSNGNTIMIVSTPLAGAADFGINVSLEELDPEYTTDNYRLDILGEI